VHTAIAFMHRPRLLLLDEATTGADVETRAHILELVRRLAAEGSAVLYSTHYLAEVGSLTGASVAVLDDGRVIARGDVAELVAAHAVPVLELAFHGDPPPLAMPDAVVVDSRRVRIPAPDPAATQVAVLPDLPPGLLESVEIVRPDLEAVYLALTGRRYEEADAAGLRTEEVKSDVVAG
jgi:ABC-2 type transport system ATP-binding protein